MNREIKFRGKYSYNGEWGFGSLLKIEENYHIVDETVMCEDGHHIRQERDIPTWVNPDTIGQYTTLLDKNGKEIYEGDILRAGSEKTLLEVRFVRGVFAFLWNGDLDDEFPCNAPTQEWAEVIGNIHDNPELLNGTS